MLGIFCLACTIQLSVLLSKISSTAKMSRTEASIKFWPITLIVIYTAFFAFALLLLSAYHVTLVLKDKTTAQHLKEPNLTKKDLDNAPTIKHSRLENLYRSFCGPRWISHIDSHDARLPPA